MKTYFCAFLLLITSLPVISQVASPSDRKPIPIKTDAPEYPDELRRARVKGVVLVEFVIGIDGKVESAKATKSPDERLSELAEAAVLKWEFEPGIKEGVPVSVRAAMPIAFELKKKK